MKHLTLPKIGNSHKIFYLLETGPILVIDFLKDLHENLPELKGAQMTMSLVSSAGKTSLIVLMNSFHILDPNKKHVSLAQFPSSLTFVISTKIIHRA